MGESALEGCVSLHEIDIPESVTELGPNAINNTGLTSVTIPAGVTSISERAFMGSAALTSVTSQIVNPYAIPDDVFSEYVYQNAPLFVPTGSVDAYKNTDGWKQFMYILAIGDTLRLPYAVLTENNTVLTFYYDDQKATRAGININNSNLVDAPSPYGTATSAVFDASFANYYPTSTAYWFQNCSALTSISGIENLKTNNVTDMAGMFYYCSGLTSLDVSGFKTANVTSMYCMFWGCSGLTSLDLSGFNTDKVEDMGGMFVDCSSLTSLDLSGFNTANVTGMNSMFADCSSLTSLDLSGFNTANVTDMGYVFRGCSALTSLDVSSYKTEKVTNMYGMFWGCSDLTSLDLSDFNTSNVTDMTYMFIGCSGLKTIYVGNDWSTASVIESILMFSGCTNLVGGMGTVYNPDHVDASYAHIDGGVSNPGYFTEKVNYNDGDIFTAETVEGIMLKYRVISEADKTCQVGTVVDTDSWISSDIANAVDDPMVEGTITIPEYAKGYRVIKIGYEAFINCTQVTSIVIPNTVTEITTAAMAQSGLTAITIPSSVSSIHYDFLHNCSNLESIVVEEGNQVYDSRNSCKALIETATNKLMMGCKTSTVPNGIETIGTAAFILCKGLTAIELPNTVTRIETQAFNSSDLSSINLPPSLEYIGYSCFAGSNVTSFVIPANVKEIMLGAFNCNGLTSIVVEQGNQVYDSRDNCNAIIETATNTLFEGFSVTVIPNSVTTIGSSAFREVWDLHEITIPESVAAIGEHAFIHTYLEKVTSERPEPVEIPDNAFSDNCYEQATLYVPQSSIEAYSTTGGWKNFKSILAIVEGGTAEPYAVLSEDSLTVTFYYDDQKTSRGGMDINNSILDNSNSPYGTATSAVFDVSFDAYRPTSTACWFENCSSLATINGIEYLHTDDVTNMSWMFECCFNLEELDLSNFNTSNVTEMYGMFLSCQGLKSLNVSSFNTSKVVGMNQMFCGLSNLTNLDLSNFDTSNVRWMYAMFADCPNLTSLDISSFNSALVSNMGDLFSNCVKLKTIYVGDGWTTTGVGENGNGLFNNCTNLIGGAGTVYAPDHIDYTYAHIDGGVSNPGYFTDKNAAPYVNPEPYVVLSDNNTVLTFYYDEKRNERNGIAIGSYGPGNYEPWYENRTTLTTAVFDESFANDTTLTSTAYWFFECIRMTEIKGLEYLKTDKVTDMRNMFYGCSKLTTLDVSHLKTDNVTNMNLMFYYCSGLTSLDVKGFNTENVTDMGSMFNNCSGLTSLDISSFKTEKVKDMIQMFYQCYNLTTIYAGNGWSTASVTADYGYHMFTDCTALVGGRGTTYDKDRANYLFAHIDGGASNPGYFTDINDSINICSDDNHPHLIDLGLSTGAKVMCRNLGAQNPEDAGDTYTWDEFMALNLDKGYRAFTENELSYIVLQCEHKLHELNGVKGQMITTKAGNSFFLPFGDYWSSEVHEDGKAFQMYVRENIVQWQRTEKSNKSYVRLVFDETAIVPDTVITPTFSSEYYYYNTIKIETETPDAEIYYTMNGRMLEGESTNFSSSSLGRYSNWKAWGDNLKEAKAEEVYDNQNYRYNYVLKLTSRVDSVSESAQLGYRFDELLTKNDYYTVRFQARSESGEGKIEFYCQNDTMTNFRSVADTMLIGKEMAEYEFTLKIDNDSTNQIVLNFGSVADTYYIDNVLFGPVISDTINDLRTRYVEYIYPQEGITIKAVATKDGMEESKPAVYDYYYDGWMTMMDTHEMGKKVCDAAIGDPNVPLELVYETLKRMEDMFYRYYEQRFEVSFDDMEIMEANDEMRHFVYMIEDMMRGFTIDGVCYHAIDSTHAEVIAPLSYYEKYRGTLSIAKEVNYNNINFQVTKVVNDAFAGSQLTAIIWNPEFVLGDDVLATIDNPNLLIYVNDASVAPDRDNIIINGRAKNIVLTDTKEGNGNFYCPKEFEAEMISYTRNFQQQTVVGVSRGWESIALPFAVQTIMHEKQGLITPFGNSASTKHFWLRRLGDSGLTQATAIEANVPYVISMPNDEVNYAEEFNLSGRVTFTAQEVTIPVTEPVTLALADSTIKMVPAFQSIGRASDVWAINVGESRDQYLEGSVFERDYREVRPFEAYTVHTGEGPAPRFVPVMEISGTTGIEGVRGLMSDDRGENWYDLNGRRLQSKPSQKGVYLHDGRKVVIR